MIFPIERSPQLLICAFALAALALLWAGCPKAARPQTGPAGVALPAVGAEKPNIVLVDCEPSTAEVIVDGRSRGSIASLKGGGIHVALGVHRIELRAAGHKPFRVELNVGQRPETLKIKLQPIP